MNIYKIVNGLRIRKNETIENFIKRYIDAVCADTSRESMKAANFYGWIYSMATYEAERVIFRPEECEYGAKRFKDEKGEYFVRNCLRPYEFDILRKIGEEAYQRKSEKMGKREININLNELLERENLERGVYRTSYGDFLNPSKKITDRVKENRSRITELMKQNQR